MTYPELIERLQRGEQFSFSRWGDGEFFAVYQDRPGKSNCDGHTYFPDMGRRLKSILESDPNYMMALQSMAYRQRKEQIDALGIDWVEGNILHRESPKSGLKAFFEVLNERDVLIVGPEHLKKLTPKYLKSPYFIEIPSKNCWLSYDETLKEINSLIGLKPWVILYSASMMSNVLIDNFSKSKVTQIDCGSVFDPYCGVNSRTYHKNMNV